MTKMRGEDFKVVIPPEIQAKIDADPKLAALVQDMNARLRQALDGVDPEDQDAVAEAMRSVGGVPYTSEDDDENPGD